MGLSTSEHLQHIRVLTNNMNDKMLEYEKALKKIADDYCPHGLPKALSLS